MTQTWLHSRHCTHLTHIHTHEDAPTYTQPAFLRTLQTNTDTNTQTYIHPHPQIDTHTHTHTHKGTPTQCSFYTRDSVTRKSL